MQLGYNYLLGHGRILHGWTSSLSPIQSSPSNFGGGLVHVLERLCVPPPQDKVHGVKLLHFDQFASTKHVKIKSVYMGHGYKNGVAVRGIENGACVYIVCDAKTSERLGEFEFKFELSQTFSRVCLIRADGSRGEGAKTRTIKFSNIELDRLYESVYLNILFRLHNVFF